MIIDSHLLRPMFYSSLLFIHVENFLAFVVLIACSEAKPTPVKHDAPKPVPSPILPTPVVATPLVKAPPAAASSKSGQRRL